MNSEQQEMYKKVHDQPIFKGLSDTGICRTNG